MSKLITWTIHNAEDERYIGQSAAFAPQTALCQVMLVLGKPIVEQEINADLIGEETYVLTHASERFIVSPDFNEIRYFCVQTT